MSEQTDSHYLPVTLECMACGKDFVFTAIAQRRYAEKGFAGPKRCHACRQLKRADFEERHLSPNQLMERACYSWTATGSCRFGNQCRFLHVDQAASPRDQGVEADDVSKSHVPPARDVAGGAASPQSTSVTVTDAYERDESKYVTTPETKYKNIAPTLPVESDQNPEIKPSTNGLVIHMDAISTRPKFDYSKASKKLKKRKPKTATSDGISTPSESAQMHTSESVESATSVLSLEKQLQNATLEEGLDNGDGAYVVTDLPINNSAPTSYMGATAWGYPYSFGTWPPYAQHVGGMVYFGPPHFPQYYGLPYPGGATYPSAQFGYVPAGAAIMFDPSQQGAGVPAAYQYPMLAQSMIPATDRLPATPGLGRGTKPVAR